MKMMMMMMTVSNTYSCTTYFPDTILCIEGNGNPLQYSCLENPLDRGACGLQSMGLLRVGHDQGTSLSPTGEGNSNPLQCSCLENPRDRGTWWAAIYGAAQSWTRLKQLTSSSSILHIIHIAKICSSLQVHGVDTISISL